MMPVYNSLGLASPRQMTSNHNSSELGIHDHSNELSSSKLVPKVVPSADKTAFSDADHAGCLDTRKSTSGGIQFLEYVALSASCAQVM
ncbi:hypothetical protein Tco_0391303 [Tanacetum coccineum]